VEHIVHMPLQWDLDSEGGTRQLLDDREGAQSLGPEFLGWGFC